MSLSRPALRLSRLPRTSSPSSSSIITITAYRSIASLTPPHHSSSISRLPTSVDTSSPEYLDNHASMTTTMRRLQDLSLRVQKGGSDKAREKHIARNKMLPRDRVTALIDPGTTFLELSPLAGHELYPEADVP